MTSENETIADIVAEMRLGVKDCKGERLGVFDCFADRIEAAATREREAGAEAAQVCGEIGEAIGRETTREKSSQVGNAAKMREALYAITLIDTRMLKRLLCELVEADIFDGGQIRNTIHAVEKARQAIAAPPRNCDVGTAEEQAERFHSFCESNKQCGDVYSCECCQLNSIEDCELAWAQMPYEEG